MNPLPPGWKIATIEEIAGEDGIVTDGDWIESKDQNPNGEVRLIQLADIGDGQFLDRSSRFMTMEAAKRLQCTFLKPGDLLIARMPDPLGRACLFPGVDHPAVTAVDILVWRSGANSADARWLMHVINSPEVREQLSNLAGGTTRQRVSGGNIKRLSIPVPPKAEQRQIVTRIAALFARTGRARTDLERIAPLSERHRLAVLRAAVTGRLTERWRQSRTAQEVRLALRSISAPAQARGGREATTKVIPGTAALSVNDPRTSAPAGWAWVPLLRVARQETGHTPSRRVPAYWDGGDVPWVGIRDAGAHHGSTIFDTIQKCTKLGLENSSARLLPAGTVCLSRTASVGYVTVLGKPMATSQDFATWTCTPALLPEYLKFALLAEGDDIRRFGEGSTHTTIYFPEIRALHICLPPVDEQAEIVRILTTNAGAQIVTTTEAARAQALLDRLEQSILNRAFRGDLLQQRPAETVDEFIDGSALPPPRTFRTGRRAAA